MRISDENAREIGRIIHDAVRAKDWSDLQAANAATARLPSDAPPLLIVTRTYVTALRSTPRQPLASEESRLKFAAVVDALDLDRETMNRLAGGI